MSEADGAVGATNGPDQDVPDGRPRAEYRIDIGGNTVGPVVAGDYNLVVDAQHGSAVTLLMEHERPRPVRRDRVELLPRPQRDPVGREADIAALARAVRAGGLVQLCGPSGIGKSTVLRHAARSLPAGPDGVVYLNAAYRETGDLAQEIFEACYQAAGYAPSAAELRRLMAGLRVTVYVDNADLTREQLLTLADAAPDATFVFAGQDRALYGGDGTALEMKGLDRTAALSLLAGELRRPLAAGEFDSATSLWEAAEGRPLLLVRAAGLARLDVEGSMRLPLPGEVTALLPLLLDQLDEAAINVLHLLATMAGVELDPVHIGAMTELPDADRICRRLLELGLVHAEEHGYRCAADSASAMNERRPDPFSVDQICRYFARWAAQPTTTRSQIADHGLALEKAAILAELAGRPDLAVQVARVASPALARSLRFGAWARLLGLGWVAARRAGDKRAEAYFTHEEGIRSLLTGRRVVAAALLAEALVLWRELGNSYGTQAALHAHQYVPSTAGLHNAPAVHGGGGTAAHTTGAAHTTAGAHTAAGAHSAAGAQSTTAHTAAAHMTNLAHGPTGLGAATQAPSAAHTGVTAAAAGGAHSGVAATTAGTVGGAHSGVAATTAGTAAGAHTGAPLAAAAAKGASALSTVLSTITVAAVVIGGIAIAQHHVSSPDTAASPSTDLAGVWEVSPGRGVRIVSTGSDSYTVDGGNSGCQPLNFEVSGSGGSYHGTQALYPENGDSCAAAIGTVTLDIEVSPDGTSAQVDAELTPSEQGQMECSTCGTETWTRSAQP